MNTITKAIVITLALSRSAFVSFAQAATAATSVTIVTPIAITKNTNMNFGNVAVSPSIAGTTILATDNSRSIGGTGGVTLPATTGTVSAANFTVSGQAAFTYAITLPASCILTDAASHTMTVDAFTSDPPASGTLNGSGVQQLYVGATLNLSAGQPTGAYTNTSGAPVTVNYN